METILFTSISAGVGKGLLACAFKNLDNDLCYVYGLADGCTDIDEEAELYLPDLDLANIVPLEDAQHELELLLDRLSNFGQRPVRVIVSEPCSLAHLGRMFENDYNNTITLPEQTFIVLDTDLVPNTYDIEDALLSMQTKLINKSKRKAAA